MNFDLKQIVDTLGYFGLFAIVFAESGLFFGFFLPGDSLLVTAGLLASQGFFRIEFLVPLLAIAAISGDSVGYWFGKKVGPRIFSREKSFLFNKDHLIRAQEFYKKHGGKTIVLARFVPIIRTFAPIVAGAGQMEYRKFIGFNILGGVFWTFSMLIFGYFLGNIVPDVDKYLLPLIFLIVFVSLLPSLFENRKAIANKVKKVLTSRRSL